MTLLSKAASSCFPSFHHFGTEFAFSELKSGLKTGFIANIRQKHGFFANKPAFQIFLRIVQDLSLHKFLSLYFIFGKKIHQKNID